MNKIRFWMNTVLGAQSSSETRRAETTERCNYENLEVSFESGELNDTDVVYSPTNGTRSPLTRCYNRTTRKISSEFLFRFTIVYKLCLDVITATLII